MTFKEHNESVVKCQWDPKEKDKLVSGSEGFIKFWVSNFSDKYFYLLKHIKN